MVSLDDPPLRVITVLAVLELVVVERVTCVVNGPVNVDDRLRVLGDNVRERLEDRCIVREAVAVRVSSVVEFDAVTLGCCEGDSVAVAAR